MPTSSGLDSTSQWRYHVSSASLYQLSDELESNKNKGRSNCFSQLSKAAECVWVWLSGLLTGLDSCPGPLGAGCDSSGSLGCPHWAWRCWGCRWWGCTWGCGRLLCWKSARERRSPEDHTKKMTFTFKRGECFAPRTDGSTSAANGQCLIIPWRIQTGISSSF